MAAPIQKMVPGPDGKMQIVYIDPFSGMQVNPPAGFATDNYTSTLNDLGLNPIAPVSDKKPEDTASKVIEKVHGERDPDSQSRTNGNQKGIIDNYGYIDRPGWTKATSFLPGPLGMASKMGNAMVDANNLGATNKARNVLGLDDLDARDSIKSFVKDPQGQVADVKIGDQNYSVGFEAMTPDNRTNLTPQEALTRSNMMGGLKEEPNPAKKDTGLFSGIFDEATSFFDSIFNDEPKTDSNSQPEYTGLDRFPDAPRSAYAGYTPESYDSPIETSGIGRGSGFGNSRSYDGKSYSGNNNGLDSPSEGGGRFGGNGLGSPDKSQSKSDKEKDRSL